MVPIGGAGTVEDPAQEYALHIAVPKGELEGDLTVNMDYGVGNVYPPPAANARAEVYRVRYVPYEPGTKSRFSWLLVLAICAFLIFCCVCCGVCFCGGCKDGEDEDEDEEAYPAKGEDKSTVRGFLGHFSPMAHRKTPLASRTPRASRMGMDMGAGVRGPELVVHDSGAGGAAPHMIDAATYQGHKFAQGGPGSAVMTASPANYLGAGAGGYVATPPNVQRSPAAIGTDQINLGGLSPMHQQPHAARYQGAGAYAGGSGGQFAKPSVIMAGGVLHHVSYGPDGRPVLGKQVVGAHYGTVKQGMEKGGAAPDTEQGMRRVPSVSGTSFSGSGERDSDSLGPLPTHVGTANPAAAAQSFRMHVNSSSFDDPMTPPAVTPRSHPPRPRPVQPPTGQTSAVQRTVMAAPGASGPAAVLQSVQRSQLPASGGVRGAVAQSVQRSQLPASGVLRGAVAQPRNAASPSEVASLHTIESGDSMFDPRGGAASGATGSNALVAALVGDADVHNGEEEDDDEDGNDDMHTPLASAGHTPLGSATRRGN